MLNINKNKHTKVSQHFSKKIRVMMRIIFFNTSAMRLNHKLKKRGLQILKTQDNKMRKLEIRKESLSRILILLKKKQMREMVMLK